MDGMRMRLAAWFEQVPGAQAFAALAELDSGAAVYAVDAQRDVVYWSEGARRLLGYQSEEVLGRHCLSISRCPQCMRGCGIAERGTVRGHVLTLLRADGEERSFEKSGRAFFSEEGEFLGGVERLVPTEDAQALGAVPDATVEFHGMVARDPAMKRVFGTIRNVAETDVTVLVRGESGSGKELVARALHAESPRRAGPFVAVNSAALTETLMESELFGHVRGAFTGALGDREGLFRQADGGTLFLDEVAELPIDVQAKLLRVLEAREVVPVGGSRAVPVDVRVVAATHRSLRADVRAGRFREDLMYRLRVVPIFLPPLCERRQDVEVLVWHFIRRRNEAGQRRVERVSPEAMRALMDHRWPGNVRELANVVAYAFAVGRGSELGLDDLPPELRGAPTQVAPAAPTSSSPVMPSRSPRELKEEALRLRVSDALRRSDGHLGRAADLLGVSRATLWRWRKRLGI